MYVVLWLVFAIWAAAVGSKKGKPVAGFFVGLLLGPIGVALAYLDKGKKSWVPDGYVACTHCLEKMREGAAVCPHCRMSA
jgi:hypothetical protein